MTVNRWISYFLKKKREIIKSRKKSRKSEIRWSGEDGALALRAADWRTTRQYSVRPAARKMSVSCRLVRKRKLRSVLERASCSGIDM